MAARPFVIVVGSGFGGLKAVQGLGHSPVDILLLDKHNYHLFQPLLYQVATAGLSPADIAYPIRKVFRHQKNVEVALAEVQSIELDNKLVCGPSTGVKYDYLVVAVGSTHSYFGHDDWSQFAHGLKTVDDATAIRKRVLLAFEEAEHEADDAARRAKLTFVVVGGGATGVELAGALREIAAKDISKDFRRIDTKTAQIILIQGDDRLLPGFPKELSDRAKSDLEKMGVQVRLNARVTKVESDRVWIGDEEVHAENILWAAGVKASPLLGTMGVKQDRSGRVLVNPDLSVPGHPEVFVIGDSAAVTDPVTHQPVPGLAPAAMQMGTFVAKIIANEVAAKSTPDQRPSFKYHDKGTLATIGTRRAVADIKGLKFGGLFAWLIWCFVHLTFLVSFRSKVYVLIGWIWAYIFRSRTARLITGEAHLEIKQLHEIEGRRVQRTPETLAK